MPENGMTHWQVTQIWEHLGLAFLVLGVLILITFLLSKYVFFKEITQYHEFQ